MIKIDDLRFRYKGAESFALRNVNLRIESGEFVLLVGDSGSGKSTLLRAINGLIPNFYGGDYCGKVLVNEKNPASFAPRDMISEVGTVLQDPEAQLVMEDVEREIAFAMENLGFPRGEITKRVEEVMDLMGIAHLRHRKTSKLSGGEKQKIAIASAMAMHPRVLLLDEPTSQIDPHSAEELIAVLQRINDELGITIILAEHRLENTMHRADRLLVMRHGVIIGDGEPRIIARNMDLDLLNVGYPPVARVAKRFGKEYLPLTVKEARKVLRDVFTGVRVRDEQMNEKPAIIFKNVKFEYEGKPVLRGVNLSVPRRGAIGVIGRNGSGKTTLAKIAISILKPTGGRVERYVQNDEMGMVFQNPALHVIGDSVYDDVAYTLKARGDERVERKVKGILNSLGIWELRDRNPLDLSGGERLLFALATVLVFQPKVLILDEPTRGLSYGYKKKLEEIIRGYSAENSVMLISHDMELVASTCSRVAMLSDGRVVVNGSRRDVLSSSLTYSPQINKLVQGYEDVDHRILTEEDIE